MESTDYMINPILTSSLFVTPQSEADLNDMISGLTPKEKALVYTYVTFTFNLCHKLVNDAIDQAKNQLPVYQD